jgi:lysyl-tRNA synthetase, class I
MSVITYAIMSNTNVFLNSKAWPFMEAKALYEHIGKKMPSKGYVLFETGYGPSGLPHIGTFGEVLRTTMVMHAFQQRCDFPTRLFCVSDDMDGMRKVPDIIPNKDEYKQYFGLPLVNIPDPFGTHESYGHHMNARLCAFLDRFGFEYEFISSSECYKNGTYDSTLLKVVERYDEIMNIMLPTLGEERRTTYSPFLPVDPETGQVLQVSIELDRENGLISYINPNGNKITSEVTGGKCKLQWKPDLGMRWAHFDVDYEIYGKDHLASGPLYTAISKTLCGKAPYQSFYELFLDEKGEKISKTKGNGITIDEWLQFATEESLAYFMYLSPQKAKKLYFDVIPKCVDEYLQYAKSYPTQEHEKQLENPVYHIHNSNPPSVNFTMSFALLLNLVSACGSEDRDVILGYIKNHDNSIDIENDNMLKELVEKAINYYHAFVLPNKQYHTPSEHEKNLLHKLKEEFIKLSTNSTAEEIQTVVYAIGRESGMELKNWFNLLYKVLLGSEQGPRFGSFAHLYGLSKTIALIEEKCSK